MTTENDMTPTSLPGALYESENRVKILADKDVPQLAGKLGYVRGVVKCLNVFCYWVELDKPVTGHMSCFWVDEKNLKLIQYEQED